MVGVKWIEKGWINKVWMEWNGLRKYGWGEKKSWMSRNRLKKVGLRQVWMGRKESHEWGEIDRKRLV